MPHSRRSIRSEHTDDSKESHSTAPTSLYSSPAPSMQTMYTKHFSSSPPTYYPRSSAETYASTVDSFEELSPESDPAYQLPEYRSVADADVRPSNPSDFCSYFPSTNRLSIRHDDTSADGNMNLLVNAADKHKQPVQLFHLKMNDLPKREFSLRRYERASGREVCHSVRKNKSVVEKRPTTIARSMSNAFSMMRPEIKRTGSGFSTQSSDRKMMRRQDSGYSSNNDQDLDFETFMSKASAKIIQIPTNTTKLEFSNYAQVEVKRREAKASKRYEFEYWGHDYSWKRVTRKDGEGKEVSYHLQRDDETTSIAHIVPELRSPSQTRTEERNGGWVPPSSMWISDESILEAPTDVADVIVATGLIALVDDCIKRHFRPRSSHSSSHSTKSHVPATEFGSPRKMMEAVFRRRNSGGESKPPTGSESKRSPLRQRSVTAY